jgi:putative membrane protein insertion efficiency factor
MTPARRALHLAGAPLRLLLIVVIHVYRVTLGGLLAGHCRFYPSCSQYAEGVIKSRGAVEGTVLAIWRVARCGPFTNGGLDPVPAPRKHGAAAARGSGYDGVIPGRTGA